jgi:phage terminase large subunit-like protein
VRDDELPIFERFCAKLILDNGKPFLLEPFQKVILRDYFDGAVETLVIISKKNGKTTLLAALALYHVIVTPEAECVIAAASRDQATIMYDAARGFVRRSPGLRDRVEAKAGYREIRSKSDAGRIRVLAADVDTADGVLPTLALVDELGRHRSAALYGVFRDGLGPRSGQMVSISAAGDNEQSPLGLMRAAARKLPVIHRDGPYLRAASKDGTFALHEWALPREADVENMKVVKTANPASWQTEKRLRLRHDSPSMLPWQWARFACGIWVGAEEWWMKPEEWLDAEALDELRDGDRVTLGFDGSRVGDATALVAARLEDGLLQPLAVWEAPDPDATGKRDDWEVPVDEVDAELEDAFERYRVVRAYFDPPLWQSEIDRWARDYGDEVVLRYWTNRARFQAAAERFRTDVSAGTLSHAGDRVLDRHVLNAQRREVRGGYWLTKSRPGSTDKIDAAIAAVLAYEARADAIADGALRPRSKVPVAL